MALTDDQMRDALRQCPHDTIENLRVRWLYAKDFARAIESAACAERDARIAELERQLAEARNQALEDAAKCCYERAMKNERACDGLDEESAISLRSAAWQMSVCAADIRAMKEQT